MSIEKTPPNMPKDESVNTNAAKRVKAAIKSLFPRTLATESKLIHGQSQEHPSYNPSDETQDWIIEDNTLIKPTQESK